MLLHIKLFYSFVVTFFTLNVNIVTRRITMEYLDYLNNELKKININKKIKIRAKQGDRQQRMSLYLDIFLNKKRKYEFIGIYLLGTAQSKAQDKMNMKLAQEYRDQKERELLNNRFEIDIECFNQETNVYEYIDVFRGQDKEPLPMYQGMKKHLKLYYGENLKFSNIDKRFCEGFRDHLLKSMKDITAKTYLAAFKAVLNRAVKEDVLKSSPCRDIIIKAQSAKREFLLEDEIIKIIECKSVYYDVKNAFLFSCFTGLRVSDIQALTYNEVRDGYLYFRQRKTGDIDRMLLTPDAQQIINHQKRLHPNSGKVFILPASKDKISRKLNQIIESSGITKKITFHCGRHTAATLWLTKGVDIFTVQKLLGHRDLDATLIYAKLIDKKRDEYVEKMPGLMKL